MVDSTKRCTACGETKSHDQFHSNIAKPDGKDHRCKPCFNSYKRSWRRLRRLREAANSMAVPAKLVAPIASVAQTCAIQEMVTVKVPRDVVIALGVAEIERRLAVTQ